MKNKVHYDERTRYFSTKPKFQRPLTKEQKKEIRAIIDRIYGTPEYKTIHIKTKHGLNHYVEEVYNPR